MTQHGPSDISGEPARPSGAGGPEPARQAPPSGGGAAGQSAGVALDSGEQGTPAGRPGDETTATAPGAAGGPGGAEEAGPTAAELEDRWKRVAADLDNLRKRYAREMSAARDQERELVAGAFLPVLDNIDRALEHATSDPQTIAQGVQAVREQALAVLAGLGYRRDDAAGVPFDPTRHEVVGVVDPDGTDVPPGAVAAVVRPGYSGTNRQLRPAAVTVAQSPET